MDITVKNLKVRKSPRKIRPVLHILKHQNAEKAIVALKFNSDSIAPVLSKLIKSGIAAAAEKEIESKKLFIKIIKCDQAQGFRRHRFGSRGRVVKINKRSSHLTLVLADTQIEPKVTKKEKQATDKSKNKLDNNKDAKKLKPNS